MKYKIIYHCGATRTVNEIPLEVKTSHHIVWSSDKAQTFDGEHPQCLNCSGCRRASKRKESKCFPLDYEKEKDGKYRDMPFSKLASLIVACIPKDIELIKQ